MSINEKRNYQSAMGILDDLEDILGVMDNSIVTIPQALSGVDDLLYRACDKINFDKHFITIIGKLTDKQTTDLGTYQKYVFKADDYICRKINNDQSVRA